MILPLLTNEQAENAIPENELGLLLPYSRESLGLALARRCPHLDTSPSLHMTFPRSIQQHHIGQVVWTFVNWQY